VRTLLKSSNAARPFPHSHALNALDGVRWCATAADRGWWRQFECYWNLLMLGFWYRTVPHVRTLPKFMDSGWMSSMTVDGIGPHANACKGVSENATLILDCWHKAQRFVTVLCRIISRYFVQYRIVSIVLPLGHIVPSLYVHVFYGGLHFDTTAYVFSFYYFWSYSAGVVVSVHRTCSTS